MGIDELFQLKNQVALVTGGAGYLGSAIVEALTQAGAMVVIADTAIERSRSLAARLTEKGFSVSSISFDASSEESIRETVNKVVAQHGSINILVNAAYKFIEPLIDNATSADFKETLNIGVTGYFIMAQQASMSMRKNGGGSIINIASMYGLVGSYPDVYADIPAKISPNYHAAKGAVVHMTRYMAVYWAKHNIRVNAISPGPFPQDKVRNEIPELIPRLEAKVPLGRIGKPEELKGAVVFLASNASSYVTGHNLVVDGGWTAW